MIALLGLLLGCSDEDYFGTTTPKHGAEDLWINNGGEPEWIDPGRCTDSNGSEVIRNIFAGLTEPHPKFDADMMPDIARGWERSNDGLVYTFHLRKTDWSDGTPLTAHDFDWSWKRVLNPSLAAKYVSNMFIFKNGQASFRRALYVTNLPTDANLASIQEIVEELVPFASTTDGEATPADSEGDKGVTLERVALTDWPEKGAFVFLNGDRAEIESSYALIEKRLAESFPNLQTRIADESIVGIKVIDDYTLQIRLENPTPYILQILAFDTFMPVPRHVIERLIAEKKNPNLWTRPENIVTNGPYVLRKWRFRQYMLFEANPKYWNAKDDSICRIKRVKTLMCESYNTCLNLYYSGEIDFPGANTSLPAEFQHHLRQFKDYRVDPYLNVYLFWVNVKKPPVDNVHVRRALSLAIDREKVVEFVTRGGQIPTQDLVKDGLNGYKGLNRPIYDPQKAKQELAEAGYPDGKNFPELTLHYNTSEGHKQIAVAIQQMWKETLGIEVNIENVEWKVYLKKIKQKDFQVARLGWIADYVDPFTFLELLTSECQNNRSNWSNSEYDRLVKQGQQTASPEERLQLFRQAEQIMADEQPMIPLYIYTRSTMLKPYLKGYWGNLLNRHPWKYMWIDNQWDAAKPGEAKDPLPVIRPNGFSLN